MFWKIWNFFVDVQYLTDTDTDYLFLTDTDTGYTDTDYTNNDTD